MKTPLPSHSFQPVLLCCTVPFSAAQVFDAMFGAVLAFPTEKAIVDKERSSGSYQLSAYFLAKTFSELPCRLILPCLYACIVSHMRFFFFSFGFNRYERFG